MLRTLLATVAAVGIATSAMAADDLLSKSWDEIVAQAKDEGELNWFVWYFQPRYREFVKPFEEEYGVKINIPEGTHTGNIDKFLAERGRDTGDIDVLAMGAERLDLFDTAELALGPLTDVMQHGGLKMSVGGYDGEGYAFGWWGNQTGIAYDPDKLAFEDAPQTVEDFGNFFDEHPGQFGFNYENGGSGPSFFQSIARNLTDVDFSSGEVTDEKMAALQPAWDWFLEHTDGYVITASNTDSLQRISAGEFMAVAAWEDHLFGLQHEGEVDDRIKFYIPEMGMNGGGNVNLIPANAPHPAAAIVFMNWITSADTQTALNAQFGSAPTNPDADDSKALVPNAQRAYSTIWSPNPFNDETRQAFVDNVALER